MAPEQWGEQKQQPKDGAAATEDGAATTEKKAGELDPATAGADTVPKKPEAAVPKENTEQGGATPDVILAAAPQAPPAAKTATTATPSKAKKDGSEAGEPAQTTENNREPTAQETKAAQAKEAAKSSGPLEAVLHMQPPEHVAKQHPSMSPPPYEHHFDSYSLVKQLEEGGYTPQQAVTSMKAVRKLLAKNLKVAQQSLVSKSDVENVSAGSSREGFTNQAD